MSNLSKDLSKAKTLKKEKELPIITNEKLLREREKELNSNLKSILAAARKSGGEYHIEKAIKNIKKTGANNAEAQIKWNKTNIETLLSKDLLIKRDERVYINPLILEERRTFNPGKKYAALLSKNADGKIRITDLKAAYHGKRELKMIDSMIKTLYRNDYLMREERGVYVLTNLAKNFLEEIKKGKSGRGVCDVNITYFDRHFVDLVDSNDKISNSALAAHDKTVSLTKRMATLKRKGYITENNVLTTAFYDELKIAKARQKEKGKALTLELSKEEQQTLKDLRIFNNITEKQLIKYVFVNDEIKARESLIKLIEKKVLSYDKHAGVYFLAGLGIRLADNYMKNTGKYRPKVLGRREEVKHDLLVYTAYNEERKRLSLEGATIVNIKTDHALRSEITKENGYLNRSIPDLRIEYYMTGKPGRQILDIEIDCGYDERTIISKTKGMILGAEKAAKKYHSASSHSIAWYCHSAAQMTKFLKTISGKNHQHKNSISTKIRYGRIIENDLLPGKEDIWIQT